jgi:hypothetical protein
MDDPFEITETERAATARLAAELGDNACAELLGLDRASLLRVILGRRIRRGTVLLLRAALTRRAEVIK